MLINKMTLVLALAAGTVGLARSAAALPQQIAFDNSSEARGKPGFQLEFDPGSRRLIAFRDISDPELAAVRIVSDANKNVPLYPLKDFPKLSRA